MMFRILSVVLVLFSLATHGLTQSLGFLDPATVPCNWHGDPDGEWLYMSTSTIVLNRTRIISSNFTNKGNVYEDSILCDPALFLLSPDVSNLTNVWLWKDYYIDSSLMVISRRLPYNLTMLSVTFSRRLSVPRSFIEITGALRRLPRLQSLAVRKTRDLRDTGFLVHMNELLVLDLSYNDINRLDPGMFRNMYNLTVILLNGNWIHRVDQYTFCGDSLPMLHSVNLVITYLREGHSMFSTPERDCNVVYECHLTELDFLRLSVPRLLANEGILEPFAFLRIRGVNELQLCGAAIRGIGNNTFACLTEVRNLLICDSKIQNLNFHALSHLTSLQQLLLNNNSLKSMSAISETHPNLINLNASNNMIERLDVSFSVLRRVTCLDFSHNRIDHVHNNTFRSVSSWKDCICNTIVYAGSKLVVFGL